MASGFIPAVPGATSLEPPPATRFNWSTDTTATDPGTGIIKVNNSDLSLVTAIYVSDITLSGFNISAVLDQAERGDLFSIIESRNQSNFIVTTATGAPTDNVGWFTIPVVSDDSNGSFSDGILTDFNYLTASQRSGIEDLNDGDVVQVLGEQLVYAGATVDPTTGDMTFDNGVEVPSGSLRVGEVLELSEGVTDLVLSNLVDQVFGFAVSAPFDDSTGAAQPFYNDYGAAQIIIPQSDDSQVITTNPINFSFSGTVTAPDVRLIDRVMLRMNGAITNFRAKITDNATGLALRYFPNKRAFETGEGGLNLGAGTNTFFLAAKGTDTTTNHFLGITPFLIKDSQQIDITFEGDTMDILGNVGGVPYFETEAHDGPPRELISVVNESFDANDAIYPDTNPATADSRNGHPIIAYDDTVAENVLFNSSMFASYNGIDISIDIDWVAESATTGGVTWGIEFERNAPSGDDIDTDSFAAQQTGTSTTNGTSGIITRTTITLTQAQADAIEALDSYRMRVQRVVSDGGDDMTGDAQILAIGIR